MNVADSVEAVISEIGFGRWQSLILITACLSQAVGPVQQLSSPLLSAPVPFRCSYPGQEQLLTDLTTTSPLVGEDKVEYPSKCLSEMVFMDSANSVVPSNVSAIKTNKRKTSLPSCPEIEYDTSTFQSTVITEWNLVCEASALKPLYQMTYAIGAIFGSTFCGQLSDCLGRKRSLQIGSVMTMVTVLITSWIPWYSGMVTMRILTGIGTILMLFPAYTIVSEVSSPKGRTTAPIFIGLTYFVALSVFGGVAYLVPHWRKLLLICNTPLLLVIPLTFIIDESPRWLLQNGRSVEAVDLLKKAAKKNGVTISSSTSSILDKLSQVTEDVGSSKLGDKGAKVENQGSLHMLKVCFSSPGIRTILIANSIIWFLLRSLYVGIVINANNFTSSNPFEYVAFSGAMGIVAMLPTVLLSVRLPRRVFVGVNLTMGGALMLLEPVVPPAYWWMKWIMVMLSFCVVCGAFQVNYAYGAELFPTVIRTRGIAFTNFVGSIGEVIAPLVTDIAVQYQWWAASVTFGLAGIVGGLLLPLLPETMGKAMPETLHDVEDRYRDAMKGKKTDAMASKETIKDKNILLV